MIAAARRIDDNSAKRDKCFEPKTQILNTIVEFQATNNFQPKIIKYFKEIAEFAIKKINLKKMRKLFFV